MKIAVGVIAGYLLWTGLWLGGNAGIGAMFPEQLAAYSDGQPLTSTPMLLITLVLSVICSLLAGAVAMKVGAPKGSLAVNITGALLVVSGIVVQGSVWSQMPLWYHLIFLTLLFPMCRVGARFSGR